MGRFRSLIETISGVSLCRKGEGPRGFERSQGLYFDAISSAGEQGYTFLEGHLNEALGELLLRSGLNSPRIYFVEAGAPVRNAGLSAKKPILLERYPEYFEKEEALPSASAAASSASYVLPNLDIEYFMKSTAVISSEMELEKLLKKILSVAVECSGAQHGYLLVEEEGDLVICAENNVSGNGAVKRLNARLDDVQEIMQGRCAVCL